IRYFHVTGVQTCALPIWLWTPAACVLAALSSIPLESNGAIGNGVTAEKEPRAIAERVPHRRVHGPAWRRLDSERDLAAAGGRARAEERRVGGGPTERMSV